MRSLRIAVIGGGIGGCAAAYFARTMLQNSKVTVYEQKKLGGRVLTYDMGGQKREIGATFFTSSNRVIMGLVNDLRLGTKDIGSLASIGVWDGEGFAFKSRSGPLFTRLKLISKYRLDLMRLTSLIEKAGKGIRRLYDEADRLPRDMKDLLNESGLNSWVDSSFREILEEEHAGSGIIEDVVEPLIRLIYNQGVEINGFAGLMTMLAVSDKHLLKLDGGNISLPMKLADSSGALIKLGHRVKKVERSSDGSFHAVGSHFVDEYNAVILAAPFELLGIDLAKVVDIDIKAREFQSVYTKILKGSVDPGYFGLRSSEGLPRSILTTSKASFSNLQTIREASNGQALYSIVSDKRLNDEDLSQIFSTHEVIFENVWDHAYPFFKPGVEIPPSILSDGLYYLNSLEVAHSSMESSSFAALNAVRLLKAERSHEYHAF